MKALIFALIFLATNALALKPHPVPEALQAEAKGADTVYIGRCNYQKREENCLVGHNKVTQTTWLLLFDNSGVLYKVVTEKDGKEQTRWSHPDLMI